MDTVEHSHDIREDSSSLHTLYATPPGKMRSITSHTTNRYHDSKRMIEAYMRDISPAMFSLSDEDHEQSVSPFSRRHWTPHVHPEGKLYFVREYQDSHTIRVVTETHLLAPSPDLAGICDSWIEYIQTRLEQIGVRITSHLELFIQLEGVHMSDCAHYLVDHLNKVQFWFEPMNTEVLGLPPVVSDSQLKLALCELYWSHVEHFPMHIAPQPISALENLISVMNHGLCDHMTSRVSTFPYNAEECGALINMLQSCRGNLSEGYTTWTLARLWTVIYRNRILNFHGEDCARLSRDQYVLYPRTRGGWSENVLKVLTFGIWNDFVARLDDVFVDHVVHVHLWKGLIVDCLADWESASHASLAALLLHAPFLLMPLSLPPGAALTISVLLQGSSLLCSIVLNLQYQSMERYTADEALRYLERVHSETLQFRILAAAFSLPRLLFLYGCLILVFNWSVVAAQCLGLVAGVFALGLSIAVPMVLWLAILKPRTHVSLGWLKCSRRRRSVRAPI